MAAIRMESGDPMAKAKGRASREDLMHGEGRINQKSTIPGGLAFGEISFHDGADRRINGTSVFDPVLCEVAYRWFCPPGGQVLDPFAGGSVRGIVAAWLGRKYTGIELRAEQIKANRAQAADIVPENEPEWIEGDSLEIPKLLGESFAADFVFSCPPYADLEVYSDDPRDISTMDYPEFLAAYREIVAKACNRLKENRFACFVVGDIRDKAGFYRGFPWHTVDAFQAAGLELYNEAVLVTAAGSLPLRVNRQFAVARKLGKTHQNVLVFCKGDWRKATEAVGKIEFGEIGAAQSDDDPASEFGEIL